jgi:hypothetical protein
MTNVQFLDDLYEERHEWKFTLIGNRVIRGGVCGKRITTNATPITIQLEDKHGNKVEIPWTSVQTI